MQRKQQNSQESREASFRPESYDAERHTVDVVFTTGADVLRQNFFGDRYRERLIVSEDAIDMERLNSGAQVLDSHERNSVRNVLGVTERAWVEDGVGLATIRFSERARDVESDVAAGIIQKVSVGYAQNELRITENEDAPDLYEVVRWTPHELSFVTVPADNGAQVRSQPNEENIMGKKTEDQDTEVRSSPPPDSGGTEPKIVRIVDEEATARAASAAKAEERSRLNWIDEHVRKFGLPVEFRAELADGDLSLDECRAKLVDALAERDEKTEVQNQIEPGDGSREADFASVLTRAIETKVVPSTAKDIDADAGKYMHLRYEEQARLAMEADGNHSARNLSGPRLADAIIKHAHERAAVDTSVLTSINANISTRALLRGYDAVRRTYVGIFRQETVLNYQNNERVALSDAPVLPTIAEGADYTEVQLSDRKEIWAIAKHGHIIRLTRKMIVNDDLGSFARLAQMRGAAAARTENQIVWAILTANGNLADAAPIFGAGTGNQSGAIAGIDAGEFYAARAAMNAQATEQGLKLGLEPRFVVFNETNRQAVEELLRPPNPYQTATVGNALVESYATGLVPVWEPEVTAAHVFFITDSNAFDTLEYGWLAGTNGPTIEQESVFTNDSIRYKVRDEFGAGAVDRRGMYHLQVT